MNIPVHIYKKSHYLLLWVEGNFGGPPYTRGSDLSKELLLEALKEARIFHAAPLLERRPLGKPYLLNYPHWHFNLTHCDRAVACVLSQKEVGVDAEVVRPEHLELVPHVLNASEQLQVQQSPNPSQTFCQLWTRKESLLKCTGEGLRDNMRHVLETTPTGQPVSTYATFESFHGPGYELCVCIENDKE